MNFWKRHIGDFAKACGHLSQGQVGAYDSLLDWLYGNEKPLPANKEALYRIGRATTKAERDNVDSVLAEFFTLTDSGYVQSRASEEIAKANAQADTNRRIAEEREAKKRARKEHESCNDSCNDSTTKHEPSQTPDSRLQTKAEAKAKSLERQAARFPEFWAAYPVKKGRADALRSWSRRGLDSIADKILADVKARIATDRQWIDGFIPHGSTYINRSGWEDAIEPVRPKLAAVGGSGYQPLPGEF